MKLQERRTSFEIRTVVGVVLFLLAGTIFITALASSVSAQNRRTLPLHAEDAEKVNAALKVEKKGNTSESSKKTGTRPVEKAADASTGDDAPSATASPDENRIGFVLKLVLPFDEGTKHRVERFVQNATKKADAERKKPTFVFEFDVAKGQENFGRGTDFGAAYALADYLSGEQLRGATTVAFLPKPIEGHAILAAFACDEIIMAKNATIGRAGADEKSIRPPVLSAYREIASRRRTVPEAIALGLLDPSIEVREVKTAVGREFVTPEGFEKIKQEQPIESSDVLKPAGEDAEFTGSRARSLGFAQYLAETRREVFQALELPTAAAAEDLGLEGDWRAILVPIKGPLHDDDNATIQKMIEKQASDAGANLVILRIDSPGGSPLASSQLASFLASLDSGRIRTVAYVPEMARSDAGVVALACNQLVMHPDAILGGSGAHEPTRDEVANFVDVIRKDIAPQCGRTWSPMAAIVDRNLDVYRCTRGGNVEYFSDSELAEQPAAGKWVKGPRVTVPHGAFQATGRQAEEMGLANNVVRDFSDLKKLYGLQNDPRLIEPGWADKLIEALASPEMAILLFIIGGAGLYIELHTPGMGIGAFIALICFVLFFWSRYLEGTAGVVGDSTFPGGSRMRRPRNFRHTRLRHLRPRRGCDDFAFACSGESDGAHSA